MTAEAEGPPPRLSWQELMDSLYLAACQDEAAPYRDWRPTRAPHRPTGTEQPTPTGRRQPSPTPAAGRATATGADCSEPAERTRNGARSDLPPAAADHVLARTAGTGTAGGVPTAGRAEQGAPATGHEAGVHEKAWTTFRLTDIEPTATWPSTPPLPDSLALGRALRPLRLRGDVPDAWEVDEEATAERAAQDELWLPVCRPVRERRLRLLLAIDSGPSMAVWPDTLRQLRQLMEQTAAFRSITTYLLDVRTAGSRVRGGAAGRGVGDPGPDSLVLVITDGVGDAWRNGDAATFLYAASQTSPTAVLSLMPQELWEFTLPSIVRAQLDVPEAAVPNRHLRVRRAGVPAAELGDPLPVRSAERVPVPVPLLELTPGSLGRWARLVASPGGRHDAAVLLTDVQGDLGAQPHTSPEPPSARQGRAHEAVRSFMGKASPTAHALAQRLAAAPLNLPVMRLIQHSLPGAKDWNLAEIMLFGLLRRTDHGSDVEDAERVSFDFAEGVREELLGLGTRAETMKVLRQVARLLGPRLASSVAGGDAVVAWQTDAADPPVNDLTRPFVRPLLSALSAVSGPYLARATRLKHLLSMEQKARISTLAPPHPPAKMTLGEVSTTVVHPSPASPSVPSPQEPSPSGVPGGSVSTASQPVTSIVRPAVTAPPRLWGNVPQRNRNFTGREELLARLRQRLAGGVTAVLPEALHGMGGVGKSQIAIEYVYRSSRDYQLIWWIPSEQTNLIVQSLIELGEQMGLRAGADRSAVPAVLEALRVGEPYSNWLLVFDNAENPHEVRQFFPNDGPGRVMVTSRNSQWSNLASSLEVDVFAREESVALIRRRSPQIPDDAADRLAESLGDLPLAVEQAAVWLAETGMPVHQYLDLFETKYAELLQVDPPADYDLPVAAAWNVSLDRLREDHPAALQLLQVCAFFAPEPIDWDLFSAVRGVAAPASLRATLDDPIKLGRAVREIGRYALARIDHRKSTIQVHRLVQRVLIEQMNSQERAEMRHCAHEILANADPRNPQRSLEWPRYSGLLPHVRASRMMECEDPWVRELMLNEARFLESRSDYAVALEVAEEAASIWRRLLGDDHEHVMAVDQVRAQALRWLNRYDDAFELQSELVERCHRVLGERHPATQRAVSFMALLHRARGNFYRARELDQRAYETLLREFGPDDPGTLQAAHNYAVSLRLSSDLVDLQEAYRVDEDTYQRRVEVLGDDHMQTLLSLHCLSIDLQEVGRYQAAVEGHEQLRERALTMLGEEHSLTVWASRELSVARRKLGDHQGAFALSLRVLELFRSKPGEGKHGLAWASLNHATDLRQTGDLAASAELGRRAMELCCEALGDEHPHTYATATNLAVTLRLLDRTTEALELNREAVDGLSRVLSPSHARTLLAKTNLASDLAVLGDTQQAYEIGAEILEESVRARGQHHPDSLAIRLNFSYDLRALGEAAKAKGLYDQALDSLRDTLGPDHPATVDATNSRRANCDIDMLSM